MAIHTKIDKEEESIMDKKRKQSPLSSSSKHKRIYTNTSCSSENQIIIDKEESNSSDNNTSNSSILFISPQEEEEEEAIKNKNKHGGVGIIETNNKKSKTILQNENEYNLHDDNLQQQDQQLHQLEKYILQFLTLQHQRSSSSSQTKKNKTNHDNDKKINHHKDGGKLMFQGALSLSFLLNRNCNDEVNEEYSLSSTITHLTSFLLNDTNTNVLFKTNISKHHVASLILPWAVDALIAKSKGSDKIQHISSSSSLLSIHQSTLWKTLAISLEILIFGSSSITLNTTLSSIGDNDYSLFVNIVNQMNVQRSSSSSSRTDKRFKSQSKDTLNNTLSQGTLNKLIPFAAQSALQVSLVNNDIVEENNNNNNDDNVDNVDESKLINMFATRCYCLLILSTLYRPTMDYICTSLISLIDDLVSDDDGSNNDKVLQLQLPFQNINRAMVTFFTLKLLETLLKEGRSTNPKKNYILLSSVQILTSLSNLSRIELHINDSQVPSKVGFSIREANNCVGNDMNYIVVKNILWYGLFDPENHMDGFYGMNLEMPTALNATCDKEESCKTSKQKSIHACYQQKLIDSIQSMFLIMSNETNIKEVNTKMHIVPLLLDGFFTQSHAFQQKWKQNSILKKNESAQMDKFHLTQFRFWCCIVNPLILLLVDGQDHVQNHRICLNELLQSIRKCLDLLSKSGSYLPSYDDPNNDHLNYLTDVGDIILEAMDEQQETFHSDQAYTSLETLFGLNHHIFHRKLHRVFISIVKTSISGNDDFVEQASNLLSFICVTYQKLRQMTHFQLAVMGCFDGRVLDENFETMKPMKQNLNHDYFLSNFHNQRFMRSFFTSINSLPSGQIQDCWNIFDNFFSLVNRKDEKDIETVADVCVMFLKAVRVTPFNAKDIMNLCETSMKCFVHSLIGIEIAGRIDAEFDMKSNASNSGLYLCGWLLSVHTKCCFWLNEIPTDIGCATDDLGQCGIPLVPILMNTVRSIMSSNWNNKLELGSLQHLASHRIEQLHSNIYLQEQQEGLSTTKVVESRSVTMVNEAKLLVDFLICSAKNRMFTTNDYQMTTTRHYRNANWKIISSAILSWVPYSEKNHIDCFLQWILFTLTVDLKSGSKAIAADLFGIEDGIPSTLHGEEYCVAIGLLNDASFFEVNEIHENFATVASKCAVGLLKKCLPSDILKSSLNLQRSNTISHYEIKSIWRFGIGYLRQCRLILETLDASFKHCLSQADSSLIFDSTLRIHIAIDAIFVSSGTNSVFSSHDEVNEIVAILSVCRSILSKVLYFEGSTESLLKELPISDFILHFLKVFRYDIYGNLDDRDVSIIQSSTLQLFSGIITYFLNFYNDVRNCLVPLFSQICNSSMDICMKVKLLRPLIKELTLSFITGNHANKQDNSCSQIYDLVMALFQQQFQKIVDRTSSFMLDNEDSEFILFSADVLHLLVDNMAGSALSLGTKFIEAIRKLYTYCYQLLRAYLHDKSFKISKLTRSCQYFLCVISTPSLQIESVLQRVNVVQDLQNIVIHYISSHQQSHPLLDAAYSECLSYCNTERIKALIHSLFQRLNVKSSSEDLVSAIFYCFDIMMNVIQGDENRQVLASKSVHLLNLFISTVGSHTNQESELVWASRTHIGLCCATSLIQKYDLLVIKGSHIAGILAAISSIYNGSGMNHDTINESIFLSSCRLMKVLLKQYTKNLYGCAPSLIGSLRCLLTFLMKSEFEVSREAGKRAKRMIQEFTKVCEILPDHKEIFKKHIMFLIFDYINFLANSKLSSWKKAELEPSIFFLLDCLSVYENQQISSIVQSTGKPLLQSMFKNFQKYQYKGQY